MASKKPKAQPYGMDVTWQAHEIEAFKAFNSMCREQAMEIHAWDVAAFEGRAIGKRPVASPALELAAIARSL